MEPENLKKIATYLGFFISNQGYNIHDPSYQRFYFDVFFNELEEKGEALHGDRFAENLVAELRRKQINVEEKIAKQKLETFHEVWNAWVYLYQEMQRRGLV